MKKTIAIWHNFIRLMIRNGSLPGLVCASSLLAVFIFMFAGSDGELCNELKIRVRYALYFSYGLLCVALIYISSTSIAKDIEKRHFHNVCSAPVSRWQVWSGEFLGIVTSGLLVFLSSSLAIAACAIVFASKHSQKNESAQGLDRMLRAYQICLPEEADIDEEVEQKFRRMQAQSLISADTPEFETRRQIREEIRRASQLCEPGAEKIWIVTWNPASAVKNAKFAILKYKFYAQNKRIKVKGVFTVKAKDSSNYWTGEFESYPYVPGEIKIPVSALPDSKKLEISFKGVDAPYLIFPHGAGIALLYDDGGIISNFASMTCAMALNLCAITALAMSCSSLFTQTVAIFVSLVAFLVGISSTFFETVLRDMSYGLHGIGGSAVYALSGFIRAGIFLTQGIAPPPIIERFTDGISLDLIHSFSSWGFGTLSYILAFVAIGIFFLTAKEIDKLQN